MPKKRKSSRNRNGSSQERTLRAVPDAPSDPDLFTALSGALASNEPIQFLATVSGVMSALDPRGRDPFHPQEVPIQLSELVDSFIDVSLPETTAALHVIRELTPDEVLAARGPYNKDLLAHFGVKGSVSDRATTLIQAAGMGPMPYYWRVRVCDPRMLVSARRAQIVRQRDES